MSEPDPIVTLQPVQDDQSPQLLVPAAGAAGLPLIDRPRLPAWARLLIYVPVVLVVGLIGNTVGSIPGVLVAMSSTGMEPGKFMTDPDAVARLTAAIPPWGIVILMYTTFVPIVVITLLFARLLDRRSWDAIGLAVRPTTPRDVLWGVTLAAMIVVQVAIYLALRLIDLHRSDDSIVASLLYGLVLFAGVGFWEELIFRGYLLPNLAEITGRFWAIVISSVLFWSIHVTAPEARDPATAFGLVMMGVLFSLCYYGTGSLWIGIVLHGTYDFLLVSLFQPHSQMDLPTILTTEVLAPAWLVGPPGKAGLLDLLYLAGVMAVVYFGVYRRGPSASSAMAA
jgi:hypothetical protein